MFVIFCVDLSRPHKHFEHGTPIDSLLRRGNNAKGLAGKKSKLFYEFVRIINCLMSMGVQVAFLLENVAMRFPHGRMAGLGLACCGISVG